MGVIFGSAIDLGAQVPDGAPPPRDGDRPFPPRDGPPGGPGRGGPGPGGVQEDTKLVKQFDKDGNERLDATERKAAREFLEQIVRSFAVDLAEGGENVLVNVLTRPLLDRNAKVIEAEGRLRWLREGR